jgi:hypothetical protein
MIDRDFYNDEFEELVKQKADQYKLYPSDKVWKKIYSSLHTRRKWFFTGTAMLITGVFFIAGKELLIPAAQIPSSKKITENIAVTPLKENSNVSAKHTSSAIIRKNKVPKLLSVQNNTRLVPQLFIYNPGNQNQINSDNGISTNADDQSAVNKSPKINIDFATDNNLPVIENFPVKEDAVKISSSVNEIKLPSVTPVVINETAAKENAKNIKWQQQSASYLIVKLAKKSRFELQEYFSPTASFRTLSGGGNYLIPKTDVQNIPIALTHLGSPNDYVNHKPAFGFEIGTGVLYRLSRNVALRTGLQFNYSSYTIEAYSSYRAQQATIQLSTTYGYSPNSITAYTNVQNFGGNSSQTLRNQYFQLSTPVGIELRLFGNNNLQFNIAGSIEPTYLLNRNSYLLATDYSNYTKEPSLFRRFNFDGGLEAFVSYRIGGLRLQLGPQFRYQLLSTYTSQYPIKENLKEYGLKIGISKAIW